jgi:L-ribulose-5-phosphate 3-epimerase
MRKAICHYSFNRRWKNEQWTPDRLAGEAKKLGAEGIDFHCGLLGDPATAAERIQSAVANHGLAFCGLALSCDFNVTEASQLNEQVENIKKWLTVAAKVKAPVCRVFGAWLSPENRLLPTTKATVWSRVMKGLESVLREATKYGVVLGLENHGLPGTGEEQAEIIRTFHSPFLKATIDVGNYLLSGQESAIGMEKVLEHAVYVHWKDYKKIPDSNFPWGWRAERCTIGEGDVNHKACWEILKQSNYKNFIALEYEGPEDEETGVPKSFTFLNKLFKDTLVQNNL